MVPLGGALTVTGSSKLFSLTRVALPGPLRYVEMPGVGVGMSLVRVDVKVGVAEGVGDALADGLAMGDGEALGDGIGIGVTVGTGVGIATGFRTPLDFFLTQTNFPDLLLHSNSVVLLFAVSPTFLQSAPLFTAACDGVTATKEKRQPRITIHERALLTRPLRRSIALPCALDMFPSCPTVYP